MLLFLLHRVIIAFYSATIEAHALGSITHSDSHSLTNRNGLVELAERLKANVSEMGVQMLTRTLNMGRALLSDAAALAEGGPLMLTGVVRRVERRKEANTFEVGRCGNQVFA